MIRYVVLKNDPITGGGRVVEGSEKGPFIQGIPIAIEGGKVQCDRCGQIGTIVCVGPRPKGIKPAGMNGKNPALNGDLVMCGCREHPKLINSSTLFAVA